MHQRHRINFLFTLIFVIHNTHDGWGVGLSFSQKVERRPDFFPSDRIHKITTRERYRSNSIYGEAIGGGGGSSRIPKSRGGADESKLESAGILGTPTPKGRRARAENTGGGRRGSEEPELDFAGGRQIWKRRRS
jgi:hypothetical protein